MADIKVYHSAKEMPLPLYYQAETFIRVTWADGEDYDIDDGLHEPAIHIVFAEGNSLISYASVIRVDLKHAGTTYLCYGLRSVFTFPASRQRGYGSKVVKMATRFIENQADADVALLWTEPHNVNFYTRLGWNAMPHMTTLVGEPTSPEKFAGETAMMLFVSERGYAGKPIFEAGDVYVGEDTW